MPDFVMPAFVIGDFLKYVPDPHDDSLRDSVERAIEHHLESPGIDQFIGLLDALDGDWDLEPSFGSYPAEESEEGADDEYALGSRDAEIDQSDWAVDYGGHLRDVIDRERDIVDA